MATSVAPVQETQAPAAVETAPVQETAVAAPEGTLEHEGQKKAQDMSSVIDQIVNKRRPGEPEAEGAQAAESQSEVASGTPADAALQNLVQEISAQEPEGEVVLRARDPKTGQWTGMDQSKTFELSIKDRQTGETKVYNKTLPELMRLAKDGISTNKQRDELNYYRQNTPQWQNQHQTLTNENTQLKALVTELLSAPDATVIQRREQYAQEMSPERQLARLQQQMVMNQRAEQARTQQQHAMQQQQVVNQHVQALASRIGPVVQEVEGLVGKEAAAGKLAIDTMPLYVNGRIPPENFPQLEAIVNGPYKAWAQAEAAKRTEATSSATKELEAAKAVRQQAQLAARQTGLASRPVGVAANGNAPAAPQKLAPTLNGRIEQIIRKPIAPQ